MNNPTSISTIDNPNKKPEIKSFVELPPNRVDIHKHAIPKIINNVPKIEFFWFSKFWTLSNISIICLSLFFLLSSPLKSSEDVIFNILHNSSTKE